MIDSQMSDSFNYCADLVYKRDRDRYLCALLAPRDYRNDLYALYAFNAEISEIGISVSEPLIGQMRLRWWIDALEPIFAGAPPHHPVALALSEVVARRTLQSKSLQLLVEARDRDLDPSPFASLDECLTYSQSTSSLLLIQALQVMGISPPTIHDAAVHLGIAWALTGQIRAIPFQLQRGRLSLPKNLCDKYGFDCQSFLDHGYRNTLPDGLSDVIAELIVEIRSRVDASGVSRLRALHRFPSPLLLKSLIAGYLDELATVNNDPFQLNLRRSGPRVRDLIKMKWSAWVGNY